MGIAEPLALVALLAAAAPLLLHLRPRRAARVARFPNVELVRSAGREAGRERIVADAWLLVARAGVVALAALAVARPYIGEHPPASGDLAGRETVVALDCSGAWPSREAFDEARAAAADVLEVAGKAGRAALLPFDDLPGPALESDAARRALDGMRPTGRDRSLAAALGAAGRVTWPSGASPGPRPRTVLLLTTPEGADEALAATPPPGVRLAVFVPGACALSNPGVEVAVDIAVDIADARLATPPNHAEVRVDVRLKRRGGEAPAEACELRLYFDDITNDDPAPAAEMIVAAADFDSAGICVASIATARPRPGALLARVEVTPSGARGGFRFLLVPPADRLRVLCLAGDAASDDAILIERALAALAAASGSSRAVLPIEAVSGSVESGGLRAFDAIVVGDVEAVGDGGWRELEGFVRSGGAVIATAPRGLPTGARRLFGVTGAVERITSPRGFRVARHAAADLGFLDGVRFHARLLLGGATSGEVALVFDDGTPALVVRRAGRGRAGLFAAGLGGLARRPAVLVPFVDALLRRVARRPDPPLVLSAADTPAVVEIDADAAPLGFALVAPDGRRVDAALVHMPHVLMSHVLMSRVHGPRAAGRASAILPCEGPGLWRLVARGGRATAGRTLRLIGVNASLPSPPADASAGPSSSPSPAAGTTRILRTRGELLAEAGGGGPVELGPVFAFLALVALAAELALMEARAHGHRARSSREGRE